MQFVKTIKKELNDICIYSKQIIVFSFWCSVILFAIALISYRMAFFLDYHQQMLIHRTAMGGSPLLLYRWFYCSIGGRFSLSFLRKKIKR